MRVRPPRVPLTSSIPPTSVGTGDSRASLARGSVIGAHQASRSMRRSLLIRDRLAREMRLGPRRPSSPTSTSSNHSPSLEASQVRGATAAHLALTQHVEGSTPSGPTSLGSDRHPSRASPQRIAKASHITFRDRLAGRTLASEPRKTGSNPVPGTARTHSYEWLLAH